MPETPHLRDQWALKGAVARLKEIDEEIRSIYEAFPELKGSAKNLRATEGSLPKPRRTMSPEARKRMSAGMRKFWARRKAAGKAGKSKNTSA